MTPRFIKLGTSIACFLAITVLIAGCPPPTDPAGPGQPDDNGAASALKTPRIACELPGPYNPDGMAVAPDGNIIVSCLTLNEPVEGADPITPCLMQITADDEIKPYFSDLPIHPETGTVCPLGIAFASDGNLYIADAQAFVTKEPYKSRILKLTIEDGKPVRCDVVVEGLNFANAIAYYDGAIYVTETVLKGATEEEAPEVVTPEVVAPEVVAPEEVVPEEAAPEATTAETSMSETAPPEEAAPEEVAPHESGVYRFELSELDPATPIKIEPDGADPHLVYTIKTKNPELPFGANGLGFAADGKMYVCNFGDQQLLEVEFAADDPKKVVHDRVVAEGEPMKSVDGLKVGEDGLVYIADFLGNAVHQIDPATGKITVLAQNGQTTGADGELDACSEVCLRDGKVYVANIDLLFGPNTPDAPYTISVFELDAPAEEEPATTE